MLTNSKSITVIIEALTSEQNLSMAGLIDPVISVKAGNLSDCQYIINENITRLGRAINDKCGYN